MDLAVILSALGAFLAAALAVTVTRHERRSLAHWLFAAGMVQLAAESAFAALSADAILPAERLHWQRCALFVAAWLPGTWLWFSLTYARGDSGGLLARWRVPLALSLALPMAAAAALLLNSGSIIHLVRLGENGPWSIRLGVLGTALLLVLLLSSVLVLMNLERTYRAAVGTMRWRIKFMVLGIGTLFAGRVYTSSQGLLFHSLSLSYPALNAAALLLACLLVLRSLARFGHFQVSVYPSQAVLHHSLTLLLAGIYLALIGGLASLLTGLGGQVWFELKAFLLLVALVLLTLALLSDRLRLRTRRFVSRHFQRPLYDYRAIWRSFTEATARCVEPLSLCAAVEKLVSQIFQALSVSIWLVDTKKDQLRFAGSTSVSQSRAEHVQLEPEQAAELIQALRLHPEPVNIDTAKQTWAPALRRLQPEEFISGGDRTCIPLLAGGELLAFMILGDRVGGLSFSIQDCELLKALADQAAASLLKIQLAERLAQAKQLEGFQAMYAFFVHDLKNTASASSLMLRNFSLHYQDPSFREDALRGMSRTVTHLNDLIGRLNTLRHELQVQEVECDLNELVKETLASQGQTAGIELVKDLKPLPRVHLDPGQIQKVVANLVLNASEAVGRQGRIRVETSRQNGWVVLRVADNGCGMAPEFVQNHLFKPFQTTKQRGLGIGMFQCKMIVEAHRGRIEVASQPGKGTSFRVLLPAAQA